MAQEELQRPLQQQHAYEIPAWNRQPEAVLSSVDLARASIDAVLESNGHARILNPERPLTPEAQASARINDAHQRISAIRLRELNQAPQVLRKSDFGKAA